MVKMMTAITMMMARHNPDNDGHDDVDDDNDNDDDADDGNDDDNTGQS